MDWFGEQDLGVKYAIVLGSLIFLVITAGVIKLIFIKRRTRKFSKEQEVKNNSAKEELHTLNKRDLEEGDLFGVHALEQGFYGGVAQSRPGTPLSFGSKSTLVAKPGSAHVQSRPGSSNGLTSGQLGVYGLRFAPAACDVDMHSAVPPSPTVYRKIEDQQRPASPTRSLKSPTTAPQVQLPQLPSPGLGVRSPYNPPSPRLKMKAPASVITYNHGFAIFSERRSLGEVQRSPSFPPQNNSSTDHTITTNTRSEGPPVIPTISFSDEDRYEKPESPKTSASPEPQTQMQLQTHTQYQSQSQNQNQNQNQTQIRVTPNYQARRTCMIGNNHLSVVVNDADHNGADPRASTTSFGGIYDSYFDGRLSVILDNDNRSSTYSMGSEGNQYRPTSIDSTSTSSSFSFPAFRPHNGQQTVDRHQLHM